MTELILPGLIIGTGVGLSLYYTQTRGMITEQKSYKSPPLLAQYEEPAWDILDPLQQGWRDRGMLFFGVEPGKYGIPVQVNSQFYSSQQRNYSSNKRTL